MTVTQHNNPERRISLAVSMLSDLKDIHSSLSCVSSELENASGHFYLKLFEESRNEIQSDLEQYKKNLEAVAQQRHEITRNINAWYDFIKNTDTACTVTYPIKYHIKRKRLKKCIRNANEAISNLLIENRFIRERLTVWEHELELRAIRQLEQGKDFKTYEELIRKKDTLASEIKYLLPTIPGICPAEFSWNEIDSLIARLNSLFS